MDEISNKPVTTLGQTKHDVDAQRLDRPTFSLASLLGLFVVLSIVFAAMTYAFELGAAAVVVAIQLIARVTVHRRTAWIVGWDVQRHNARTLISLGFLFVSACFVAFTIASFSVGIALFDLGEWWQRELLVVALICGGIAAIQTAELLAAVTLCAKKGRTVDCPTGAFDSRGVSRADAT